MPDQQVYQPPATDSSSIGSYVPLSESGRGFYENCPCRPCREARGETRTPPCTRCDTPSTYLQATVSGGNVCPDCARRYRYRCGQCHRLSLSLHSMAGTDYGYRICRNCASSLSWWECANCTILINESYLCSECRRDSEDNDYGCDCGECGTSSEYIQSYTYKPRPQFHGSGPLYLGVELEIELNWDNNRSECAELARTALGELGYLKSDSSVTYGFEIVTHPMSHAWASSNFPWRMLRELRQAGAYAATCAGLHIHVSRAGFSGPAHVYRWLQLFYRNVEGVTAIARRTSDEWAPFDRYDMRRHGKDYAKGDRDGRRYAAINCQNPDTFEIRVFASTLAENELRAAMDLAAASVEYTRTLTAADIVQRDGWGWPAFCTWVSDRPEYAALAQETAGALCAC